MPKTTLSHRTASDILETRTTSNPYRFVVVGQIVDVDGYLEAHRKAMTKWFRGRPDAADALADSMAREQKVAAADLSWRVQSWHHSREAAEKAARALWNRLPFHTFGVEQINGGAA